MLDQGLGKSAVAAPSLAREGFEVRQSSARKRLCIAALVLASAVSPAARADDAQERWQFGEGKDGQVTARLLATNKLSTAGGALSYSPVLTIACNREADPQWREWLKLNDKVSASGTIVMSVEIDADSFEERWAVHRGGRVLFRAGADGISSLAPANHLSLSWRFGLLSGRGEARFDLAGTRAAIARIAASCGADVPQ